MNMHTFIVCVRMYVCMMCANSLHSFIGNKLSLFMGIHHQTRLYVTLQCIPCDVDQIQTTTQAVLTLKVVSGIL